MFQTTILGIAALLCPGLVDQALDSPSFGVRVLESYKGHAVAEPRYVTVDFGRQMNIYRDRQDFHGGFLNSHTFPEVGKFVFNGVPFQLGAHTATTGAEGYGWNAYYATGDNPRTLEISVGIENPTRVYTLANQFWGLPKPSGTAAIEFVGSDGAFHRKVYRSGVDVRDYNRANKLPGPHVDEAFNNHHGQHLDRQVIELPKDFHDERLEIIRVVDTGISSGHGAFGRFWLLAVTAECLPPTPAQLQGRSRLQAVLFKLAERSEKPHLAPVPDADSPLASLLQKLAQREHPEGHEQKWRSIDSHSGS